MFTGLTNNLRATLKSIKGQGRITTDNVDETCQEIRKSLLEADVALDVVTAFIEKVKTRAIGEEVSASLTPGQAFVKILHQELTDTLGNNKTEPLSLATKPPAVMLFAGLQGAGKTTNLAKIGHRLKTTQKKRVMVVSADVYRPAAIEQLETLATNHDLIFFPSSDQDSPQEIAKEALKTARRKFIDVLLVDTAGRMQIDAALMDEIKELHGILSPIETLFVVDSMTGQDAANTTAAFNEALELTGVILTKTDGDARGGAALSIRSIANKPIKFMGTGEKIDDIEVFHPDRVAGRILGMGDMMSLIEDVQSKVDKKQALKLKKSTGINLNDFLEQLQQMEKLGGLGSIASKLPGFSGMADRVTEAQNNDFKAMSIIIQSMTKQERLQPDIIKSSRKKRIALGSGKEVQDVNRMLKQFHSMQKMVKKASKGGMKSIMRTMGGAGGMGNMNPFKNI